MNILSRLQYISQGKTATEQEENIMKTLDQGADWIQVRWKNAEEAERHALCEKALKLCRTYSASCIINDSVHIARSIDADGVHLGLNDETVETARAALGKKKIIGGTANTLKDIIRRKDEGCHYIGLGPFRFTETKEKLSPIIGLAGYQHILNFLKQQAIECPPVFAIGGIELSDIENIRDTGIYGVALSGLITRHPQLVKTIKAKLK